MRVPKTRIVLQIFGLIIVGFLAWVAFQPPPGRPNVSITLLGYTNASSGARLAMIAVTNLATSKILIYLPRIETQAPAEPRGFTYYDSGHDVWWHAMLDGGASGTFTIPPPTNQLPWRLSFFVYNDFGAAQIIRRFWTARHMPFEIDGNWIESNKKARPN